MIRAIPTPITQAKYYPHRFGRRLGSTASQCVRENQFVAVGNPMRGHFLGAHHRPVVHANNVVPYGTVFIEKMQGKGCMLLSQRSKNRCGSRAFRFQPTLAAHDVTQDRRQVYAHAHVA